MSKFIVLDVETTDIKPENGQVIELSVLVEDTEKLLDLEQIPMFHCLIAHEKYSGSPIAINMNSRIFEALALYEKKKPCGYNVLPNNLVAANLKNFLLDHFEPDTRDDKIYLNVAGKNVGSFDIPWVKTLPYFDKYFNFNHRTLDPSILYMDFLADNGAPNFEKLKERAGLPNIEYTHDATTDCWETLMTLRQFYAPTGPRRGRVHIFEKRPFDTRWLSREFRPGTLISRKDIKAKLESKIQHKNKEVLRTVYNASVGADYIYVEA